MSVCITHVKAVFPRAPVCVSSQRASKQRACMGWKDAYVSRNCAVVCVRAHASTLVFECEMKKKRREKKKLHMNNKHNSDDRVIYKTERARHRFAFTLIRIARLTHSLSPSLAHKQTMTEGTSEQKRTPKHTTRTRTDNNATSCLFLIIHNQVHFVCLSGILLKHVNAKRIVACIHVGVCVRVWWWVYEINNNQHSVKFGSDDDTNERRNKMYRNNKKWRWFFFCVQRIHWWALKRSEAQCYQCTHSILTT